MHIFSGCLIEGWVAHLKPRMLEPLHPAITLLDRRADWRAGFGSATLVQPGIVERASARLAGAVKVDNVGGRFLSASVIRQHTGRNRDDRDQRNRPCQQAMAAAAADGKLISTQHTIVLTPLLSDP